MPHHGQFLVYGGTPGPSEQVGDLLLLDQDHRNRMPPMGGLVGGFLGVPPVATPAITQQGNITPMQIAALKAQVKDFWQLVKGGGFKTQVLS